MARNDRRLNSSKDRDGRIAMLLAALGVAAGGGVAMKEIFGMPYSSLSDEMTVGLDDEDEDSSKIPKSKSHSAIPGMARPIDATHPAPRKPLVTTNTKTFTPSDQTSTKDYFSQAELQENIKTFTPQTGLGVNFPGGSFSGGSHGDTGEKGDLGPEGMIDLDEEEKLKQAMGRIRKSKKAREALLEWTKQGFPESGAPNRVRQKNSQQRVKQGYNASADILNQNKTYDPQYRRSVHGSKARIQQTNTKSFTPQQSTNGVRSSAEYASTVLRQQQMNNFRQRLIAQFLGQGRRR